jgi:hypothetical protein
LDSTQAEKSTLFLENFEAVSIIRKQELGTSRRSRKGLLQSAYQASSHGAADRGAMKLSSSGGSVYSSHEWLLPGVARSHWLTRALPSQISHDRGDRLTAPPQPGRAHDMQVAFPENARWILMSMLDMDVE